MGLDNGLWILPYTGACGRFCRRNQSYIEAQGGASKTFLANAFDEATEAEILERFRQIGRWSISSFKSSARTFWRRSRKRPNAKILVLPSMKKMSRTRQAGNLVRKGEQRDFVGGEQAEQAVECGEKCRQSLLIFATVVSIMSRPGRRLRGSCPRQVLSFFCKWFESTGCITFWDFEYYVVHSKVSHPPADREHV